MEKLPTAHQESETRSAIKPAAPTTVILENEKENIEPNAGVHIQPRYKFYHDMGYSIDPKIGLVYNEKQVISKQRQLAFTFIKQAGSNIFKGKSVTDITLPVSVFEPCSSLERLARLCQLCPPICASLPEIADPIERMRRVMSWSIATLHLGISQSKPFDSALGETMQAKIGDLYFYAEQRQKTTPTMLLLGKNICVYGDHRIIPHTYPNSARVVTEGVKTIVVYGQYSTVYTVSQPEVLLKGVMMGKRTFRFKGDILYEDKTNNIYGLIRINPTAKGFFSGLFTKQTQRDDYFKGFITYNKELLKNSKESVFTSKDILSACEGNWIDNIKFDGKIYWDLEQYSPTPITRIDNVLPSDTSHRKDIDALRLGDAIEAQKLKEIVENSEKRDAKLRENAQSMKKK